MFSFSDAKGKGVGRALFLITASGSLEEVLEHGNGAQKAEAKTLLDEINNTSNE